MASDTGADNPGPAVTPERVVFDYIKGPSWRTYRGDGCIGGITPSGQIHMAFYTERGAIPRRLVHGRGSDGTLGEIIERVDRGAIIREMDFDLVVSEATARSMMVWLRDRLKELGDKRERPATGEAVPASKRPLATKRETPS